MSMTVAPISIRLVLAPTAAPRIGHAISATGHGAPCGALPGRRRSTAVAHHERGGKDDLSLLCDGAALDPVHKEADRLVDHLDNRMFGARQVWSQAANARNIVGRGDGNVLRTTQSEVG